MRREYNPRSRVQKKWKAEEEEELFDEPEELIYGNNILTFMASTFDIN